MDLLGWLENPWASQWATVSGRQRHLLQVQASDTLLGALTRKLRRIGAWDDSLVIITADHGMGFSVGDSSRGLSTEDTPDLVWTPLFVKYPGQTAGTIDDRPARSLDVLPTIADVLGIRIPWAVDGRSLLKPAVSDPEVPVLAWPFDTLHPAAGSRLQRRRSRAGLRRGDPAEGGTGRRRPGVADLPRRTVRTARGPTRRSADGSRPRAGAGVGGW